MGEIGLNDFRSFCRILSFLPCCESLQFNWLRKTTLRDRPRQKYNFLLQQKEGYILVKGPHSKKIYQLVFFYVLAKMGSNGLEIYLSEQERYWKWQIRFMCIHQEQVCKTSFDIKVYLLGGIIIIITISSK